MTLFKVLASQALITLLLTTGCATTSENRSTILLRNSDIRRNSDIQSKAAIPTAFQTPVAYSALRVRLITKPFIPLLDKQTINKIVARTPVTDRSRLRFVYLNNEQLVVFLDNIPGQHRTSFAALNAPGISYDAERGEAHADPP